MRRNTDIYSLERHQAESGLVEICWNRISCHFSEISVGISVNCKSQATLFRAIHLIDAILLHRFFDRIRFKARGVDNYIPDLRKFIFLRV